MQTNWQETLKKNLISVKAFITSLSLCNTGIDDFHLIPLLKNIYMQQLI